LASLKFLSALPPPFKTNATVSSTSTWDEPQFTNLLEILPEILLKKLLLLHKNMWQFIGLTTP
jgi:hypothetical protein